MAKWLGNVVLLLGATAVGLGLAEVGTRLLAPQVLVRAYSLPDPEVGNTMRPSALYHDTYFGADYWVRTNSAGLRMDEEVDMSPSRRRVVVYGDSYVFGWGVNAEDSFFTLIKRTIEAQDPTLQLLNAGVGAYSTGHVKKQLDRNLFAPIAAVYFFNSNDVLDNAITDINYRVADYRFVSNGTVEIEDRKVFAPWKRFLLIYTPYGWLNQHSHLFMLAKEALKRGSLWNGAVATEGGPSYTVTGEYTDAQVERLVALSLAHMRRVVAAARGIPLLVVWIPSPDEMFRPELSQVHLLVATRVGLANLAGELGTFTFVDLVPLIRRGPEWTARSNRMHQADGHFSVEGNRWFAELVVGPISKFLDYTLNTGVGTRR
jgi:hypothetical protein